LTVWADGIERSIHRPARVHDKEVARIEPLRQIAEAGMLDGVSLEIRDQQAHAVPRQPARFRRLGGFELCGQDKVRD
jgi:hypothetical protein